ncbi:HlyD family secretion protein [Nisaea sp.]|uniref:HlyD family secretion protein n=1 Tax=Nisaea sp. TaxID=2024842 RepID=UPI003B5214BE
MVELLLCSMLTVLPDYLARRYLQGKRWGHELTFFTVWFELRWGITLCILLTVTLITIVFYYHPSTTHASSFYRTVTILPQISGRVSEVHVVNNQDVERGQVLFRLDNSQQLAALATAERRIEEVEADFVITQADLEAAASRVNEAKAHYRQVKEELDTQYRLKSRNSSAVRQREIDSLEIRLDAQAAGVATAEANHKAVAQKLNVGLPARKASAEAALQQALVELDKTTIRAGEAGRIEQFGLQEGDVINQAFRPAGILVPTSGTATGRRFVHAGFNQLAGQVIKPGMLAEISCMAQPFTVIPMVITQVQDVIAAGQLRPTDQLFDIQDARRPGTITAYMEPLYEGGIANLPPGSRCIANAYTSNHERLASEDLGTGEFLFLHLVDTVGLIHALLLRIQTIIMPVQALVFSGH